MPVTVQDAINRGTNMMPVGFLVAIGFGLLTVMYDEIEWIDRVGDIILFLIAIVAILWYFHGENRFRHSVVPIILVFAALATKLAELGLEFGDPASAGDEFGVIPALVLILIFSILSFRKAGKELSDLAGQDNFVEYG